MLDIHRFRTGRYYVHLPNKDIHDRVMMLLEEEGFVALFGGKLSQKSDWSERGTDTYITSMSGNSVVYIDKGLAESLRKRPLKAYMSGEVEFFDLEKFLSGNSFINLFSDEMCLKTFNFLKKKGVEIDEDKTFRELGEARDSFGRRLSVRYLGPEEGLEFSNKAEYVGKGLEELESSIRIYRGVQFNLDKFRTGKFYVNIPSVEREGEIRKFLEDNGFEELEGEPLTERTRFSGSDTAVYCTGIDKVSFTSGTDWLEERGVRKMLFRSYFNEENVKELKKILLDNFIDHNGDLVLTGLDFSDFDGDVYLNDIKVKNNLIQTGNVAGEKVYQTTGDRSSEGK